MTILCIETSTQVCSAALCRDEEVVVQYMNVSGSNHAQLLPRYVQQTLERLGNERLDAVALSEGPGSYTGLRIGASTAKGLCYGRDIPLIVVPTLQVMTMSALRAMPEYANQVLCPMMDARRMEVYTATYQMVDGLLRELSPVKAQVVVDDSWLPQDTEVICFGDGSNKCREILASEHVHWLEGVIPQAQDMIRLALNNDAPRLHKEQLAYYEPFYLKEFVAAPSHVKGLRP